MWCGELSMRFAIRSWVFLLIFIWMPAYAVVTEKADIPFLSLADIHFDPFTACQNQVPCPLIQALRQAPASQWSGILAAQDKTAPAYRQDTGYPLLKSALDAAKAVAAKEHVQFVLVLGDFIGHDYRKFYRKYAQDNSYAGFQSFIKKTFEFLNLELAQTFPNVSVYSVVGNNDSYNGDYHSKIKGKFFADSAILWSSLIKNKQARADMQRDFPTAGYYAVDVAPGLRLIVLNTVLFATKAKGEGVDQAATTEFTWLHNQLMAAAEKKQKVLLAMHIPAGIDVYASLQYRLLRLIELWQHEDTDRYEAELKMFSPVFAGIFAGHLHADWFQILTLSNENRVPVTGTPSISPIFGNNPGFKVYVYSPKTQQVENFETYYYPIEKNSSWGVEYSFDKIYQPNCYHCPLADGMNELAPHNALADYYKLFYAVSTTAQPITTKWFPYYWCAIREVNAADYTKCTR